MAETATGRRAAADPTSGLEGVTEAQHIKLLLLGKTGTGKSSLGRTILGENVFEIHNGSNPGTSRCQRVTRQVDDANITVIDTPGFFDNRMPEDARRSAIIDMMFESSEGLDAFLILFKVERFTEQENEVVSKIKNCFSEEAFRHAVVVFTHGDQLDNGRRIEEFVSGNRDLCDLLEKCGNRCCVVDNRYWNNNQQDEYRNNQVQVAKLLRTVKRMVRSRGRYTNEMLQEVKRMEKRTVLKKLAGVTTGVLLGALLGVPCMVFKVMSVLKDFDAVVPVESGAAAASGVESGAAAASGVESGAAAASGVALKVAAGVCAAVGAGVGGFIGYQEADKADSVQEAIKNTAKAVFKKAKEVSELQKILQDKCLTESS